MRVFATYFGSSGWLIDLDGFRILIDPWFSGDLFFNRQDLGLLMDDSTENLKFQKI